MIFVLAGTGDARELAIALNRAGFPLLASVATDNAARSLLDAGIPTRVGKLTATEMVDLWKDKGVRMVVDASHPFAEEAHRHAMRAAETFNVPYLRFERAVTRYDGPITWVAGYEEAADVAFEKKGSIFLATGGKRWRFLRVGCWVSRTSGWWCGFCRESTIWNNAPRSGFPSGTLSPCKDRSPGS